MAITTKKPMIKETVGGMYYCFNTKEEKTDYDAENYEENVTKCNVVKNIATTENAEATTVRASGEDYETINQASSVDMAIEVVAFDAADLAKMRGEDTSDKGGLILSGAPSRRPYFAFGKVVKKIGGVVEYAWYPKCQLVENTDDIATSEDTFSEQNDTVTIRAYAFDDKKQKKAYVNSETENFPKGLTEEKFFAKPILTKEDLAAAVAPVI